jgi:hypothetical protein
LVVDKAHCTEHISSATTSTFGKDPKDVGIGQENHKYIQHLGEYVQYDCCQI